MFAVVDAQLYGVISYLVSQTTRELGIRMALGATPARIRLWVLGQAFALSAAGGAAGLAAAAALARTMRGFMFGVDTADAGSVMATAAVLLVAALLASYVPARPATRIDPVASMRAE